MSTPGSARSDQASSYTPLHDRREDSAPASGSARPGRIFRWRGIIPFVLLCVGVFAGWTIFGERIVRDTIVEAGTQALGTQFDIGEVKIRLLASAVELNRIAVADPFDRDRNLFEIRAVRLELERKPLFEKKLVIKRLSLADLRIGTRRSRPATVAATSGFATRSLAEVKRFSQQFNVPLLSLIPIDTLKALVLDPTKLKAVQAALTLARATDSAKRSMESAYAGLRLQETIDASATLVARLQGTNVRTLGIDGARRAIADVRRATTRIDSAKGRVDALVTMTRRSVDSLQTSIAAIDAARRDDYAYARGLLQLPSFDAPDIGAALFGRVTIDKFERVIYWMTLARQYAPPGLLPIATTGPKRVRRAGTTVHFAKVQGTPRFLLRRADVKVTVSDGQLAGAYALAASNVTSDPTLVAQPTLFSLRRAAQGSDLDSLHITGMLDHADGRSRDIVNVHAAGVRLPAVSLPSLPYSMDPGRGTSDMRFALDGDQIVGRWMLRSARLSWRADSLRAARLNPIESLVSRVLTAVDKLDLTAEITGTLKTPRLQVSSNLDQKVAQQLRAVAGQEITAAEARVRIQVDKLVDEKTLPLKARIGELRATTEQRGAEARARLDDERRKLDERLRAMGGGLVALPGLRE